MPWKRACSFFHFLSLISPFLGHCNSPFLEHSRADTGLSGPPAFPKNSKNTKEEASVLNEEAGFRGRAWGTHWPSSLALESWACQAPLDSVRTANERGKRGEICLCRCPQGRKEDGGTYYVSAVIKLSFLTYPALDCCGEHIWNPPCKPTLGVHCYRVWSPCYAIDPHNLLSYLSETLCPCCPRSGWRHNPWAILVTWLWKSKRSLIQVPSFLQQHDIRSSHMSSSVHRADLAKPAPLFRFSAYEPLS